MDVIREDREGENPEAITEYTMHVSARYLDLTRQKLELTRLPRDITLPSHRAWEHGTPKPVLEPLIDFWIEEYNWRDQEAIFNDSLPQFRTTIKLGVDTPPTEEATEALTTTIQPPLRVHFAHKQSPRPGAIPLLFCHGWPGSFVEVSKVIDALCDPISSPFLDSDEEQPVQRPQSFHVVAPSIPGFGFSDSSADEAFGLRATADLFDALMRRLGYEQYVAHGAGWGFKICRVLALHHSSSCVAVHTANPEIPKPTLRQHPISWMKYQAARLTRAKLPPLTFGYLPSDLSLATPNTLHEKSGPRAGDSIEDHYGARPQTTAFSLCDSPAGLLACMLDAVHSSSVSSWSQNEILNWTMMQWLPGPEAGLRWLRQAQREAHTDLWDARYSRTALGISMFRVISDQSDLQRGCPPMWAGAYQRVTWVKRHDRAARRPAWDAPDDLVMDMREFFRTVSVGSRKEDPAAVDHG